ncbi:MAG: FliM/FliN family flagellar motor switch protein [Firmicutes bacterium]|jgi:flagellar motor switch protein FliN/FliY|nr:FliM/FliN family flagellar motor switch protein [Bacillota bacterium]
MTTDVVEEEKILSDQDDIWNAKSARLKDVHLMISAQIGRTKLPIRSVLDLAVGQVIELDRQVGSPIDIVANNEIIIAKGEVVEVNGEYGVRITEVVNAAIG